MSELEETYLTWIKITDDILAQHAQLSVSDLGFVVEFQRRMKVNTLSPLRYGISDKQAKRLAAISEGLKKEPATCHTTNT
jgi:hypothetical protein